MINSLYMYKKVFVFIFSGEKLLWRNVSKASVARCKFTRCCEKDCIKKLQLKTIETLRFKYWTKQRSARRQWLLERIKASRRSKSKPLFVVEEAGVALCQRGFMSLYGVSNYTYYNIKQEAIKGAEHASGSSKNREHSARFIIALKLSIQFQVVSIFFGCSISKKEGQWNIFQIWRKQNPYSEVEYCFAAVLKYFWNYSWDRSQIKTESEKHQNKKKTKKKTHKKTTQKHAKSKLGSIPDTYTRI